jgi:hypothetical protein
MFQTGKPTISTLYHSFPAFQTLTFFLYPIQLQFCHQKIKTMYTQEILNQSKNNITGFFSAANIKCFFSSVLCPGSFISVSVYVWVRLLFHDLPFEIFEEIALVLRILFTGWGMAALCIGGFNLMLFIADNYIHVYKRLIQVRWRLAKSTKMEMNDETLHHTDIPLGESFFIINGDVKGL